MSYKTLYHHHFPHCLSALVFCCSSFGSLCSWHIVSGLALGYHAQFCLRAFALALPSIRIHLSLMFVSPAFLFQSRIFSNITWLEKSFQTMLTKMTLPSSIVFSSFTFLHNLNHAYTLTLFYILTDLNIDSIFMEGRDSVYHCVPQA